MYINIIIPKCIFGISNGRPNLKMKTNMARLFFFVVHVVRFVFVVVCSF